MSSLVPTSSGTPRGPAPVQQTVSWVGPCVASGLTRTVIHFFPAARGVASPYAVSCRLTLFGEGAERRSVVLEGARLNQPDGLFVEEAFPELAQMTGASGTGSAGLELELFTDQPRVDVGPSRCVFEYHSGLNVVRFNPVCISVSRSHQQGAACLDNQVSTSLIVINRSKMPIHPSFSIEFRNTTAPIPTETVAGQSVAEFALDWKHVASVIGSEQFQWGSGLAATVRADEPLQGACGALLMYRDVQTKQPLSVIAL